MRPLPKRVSRTCAQAGADVKQIAVMLRTMCFMVVPPKGGPHYFKSRAIPHLRHREKCASNPPAVRNWWETNYGPFGAPADESVPPLVAFPPYDLADSQFAPVVRAPR